MMNFVETVHSILMTMPFSVCLLWTVILLLDRSRDNSAGRSLVHFSGVCAVLYFCHALNLLGYSSHWVDCVWIVCSLASYPLFWLYVKSFTEADGLRPADYAVLLPSVIMGICAIFTDVSMVVKVLFLLSVILVCYFSYRRLSSYEIKVRNYYSNIENKSPKALIMLIYLMFACSIGSAVLNVLGREYFRESELAAIPAVAFSVLLFSIMYIGSRLQFTALEMSEEELLPHSEPRSTDHDSRDAELMEKIDDVLIRQEYYTHSGLTVSDLATAIGSNKTYVSSCINSMRGVPFNEYVNAFRIELAKKLLLENKGKTNLTIIGEMCGYTSSSTFYRNFKACTGMTPSDWLAKHSSET